MVLLILPLQANGAVKGETITVTPDLGETENSPFQYKKLLEDREADGGGDKIREK